MIIHINHTIMVDVPEYQTLVSFTDDSYASLFEEWLEDIGLDEFRAWAKKATRRDTLSEMNGG